MSANSEEELKTALKRLETSVQKILETRGYNKDVKRLKILEEMIREQLTNGYSRHSTRTIR